MRAVDILRVLKKGKTIGGDHNIHIVQSEGGFEIQRHDCRYLPQDPASLKKRGNRKMWQIEKKAFDRYFTKFVVFSIRLLQIFPPERLSYAFHLTEITSISN